MSKYEETARVEVFEQSPQDVTCNPEHRDLPLVDPALIADYKQRNMAPQPTEIATAVPRPRNHVTAPVTSAGGSRVHFNVQILPQGTGRENWRLSAECRGAGTDSFYRADGEKNTSWVKKQQVAKAICERCRVSKACLDWALNTQEPAGIWGGLTAQERGINNRIAG